MDTPNTLIITSINVSNAVLKTASTVLRQTSAPNASPHISFTVINLVQNARLPATPKQQTQIM